MSKLKRKQGGFTIIEILVYIAVLVLVSLGAVVTYLSLDQVLLRNQAERLVSNNAESVFERVLRTARNADSVDSGGSTFNSNPGTLVVDDGSTITSFYLSGGRVMVSENGTEVGPLTGDSVTVDSLTFWHFTDPASELVRIELTISANNRAASTTRTFYTSTTLRGTYE